MRFLALSLVVAATLIAAPTAAAGTVTYDGSTVLYVADAGETDNVTISHSLTCGFLCNNNSYAVSDPGGIAAGTGCTGGDVLSPNTAYCAINPGVPAVDLIQVELGNQNDAVTVSSVWQNDPARLEGGRGDDTLTGSTGNDLLRGHGDCQTGGTVGNIQTCTDGGDTLNGGAGNDDIQGHGSCVAVLLGGCADGSDTIDGGDGADSLNGYGSCASPIGSSCGDVADSVAGGAGNDVFTTSRGGDSLAGGDGLDRVETVLFSALSGVDATLSDTALVIESTSYPLSSIEQAKITGDDGGDDTIDMATFTGSTEVLARGGNDTIIGGVGNDLVEGGANADNITGGLGNDTLQAGGTFSDELVEAGDVNFLLTNTSLQGLGTDTIGGFGFVDLTGGSSANTLDASAVTTAQVLLHGGAGNDTLIGGDGLSSNLFGGAGDDALSDPTPGTGGAHASADADFTVTDTSMVGEGSDTLSGITYVFVTGGASHNVLDASAFSGGATLTGNDGADDLIPPEGSGSALGGNGADRLVVTFDGSYALRASALQRAPGQTFSFSGIEVARLNGGENGQTINAFEFLGQATIDAGGGNDTLIGGSGANTLIGGEGNDSLTGNGGADTYQGGSGDDAIQSEDEVAESVDCGEGALDSATGDGVDNYTGCEAITIPYGCITTGSTMRITTVPGDPHTLGRSGSNLVVSGPGVGSQCTGVGVDEIDTVEIAGGGGDDEAVIDIGGGSLAPGATPEGTGSSDIEIAADLGEGADSLVVSGGSGRDRVVAGAGGINLNGDDDPDLTVAGAEATKLAGNGGNDVLTGAGGRGTGAAFADALVLDGGAGKDGLTGGAGADALVGGAGRDTLRGGAGVDVADYSAESRPVTVRLDGLRNDGTDGLDNVGPAGDIENVSGGSGNDRLVGSRGANGLDGGPGRDRLSGGRGADRLTGAGGRDSISGGTGKDTAVYTGSADVTVTLDNRGGDGAFGEGDNVRADVENVVTAAGSDRLVGSAGANRLEGGAGADTLEGRAGNDVLVGGPGEDSLAGEGGNDTIDAADGAQDTVLCGGGTDQVSADAGDVVAADCESVTTI